jgi:adenosine kinase
MSALICGSFAFDTIMVFSGQFKNEILPDKVHILNVAFLVPELRREFGGTAGNIAYNLKLLGGEPVAAGTVGKDFAAYAEWMDKHGISRQFVQEIDNAYTAQAYITTDLDDNQITAFHPGAMSFSENIHAGEAAKQVQAKIAMVSPDSRNGMIKHAAEFAESGVPFIFDPGQGLPMFSGDELKTFIAQATYMAVNDYESEIVMSKTGLSLEEIAGQLKALIVTRGGKGAHIYTPEKTHELPVAHAESLADPTGCGDAFRAGILYGLLNGLDWDTTGRIASLMGAYNIERPGTQNHKFTMEAFKARYQREFGGSF